MKPLVQEFPQRVFGIFEEQTVVAQRRHGNGDLGQVVEILQHRTLQKNCQTQDKSRSGGHSPAEARAPGGVCGRRLSSLPGLWAPASAFASLLHRGPSLPGTALLPLLAPDGKHSSGQEGHPPGPGLTPAYVLRSPLPGTDPNKSALGEAPLLLFCLTTNIEVVTINTASPWRWKGADMTGLEWFSDVAPTPHRNMRHG